MCLSLALETLLQFTAVSCHLPPENCICLQESAHFLAGKGIFLQEFWRKAHCPAGIPIFLQVALEG